MLPSVVRVRSYRQETHDSFTLVLEPPAQTPPYAFRPGQFNMLYVFGVGEAPISLSGDAADPGSLVHTIRAVGPVTQALGKLRAGDAVGVRGPFGTAWPLAAVDGQDVVLVSGGIGLAPLRPVIYDLLRRRTALGRLALRHGMRSPADLLFADEMAAWGRRDDCDFQVTVDQADSDWRGPVGLVTALFSTLDFDPARAIALLCGPEVMMRHTANLLAQRGVSRARIYWSLERNMQCAVGFCGHCQFGPSFVCMDGPVFAHERIADFLDVREA